MLYGDLLQFLKKVAFRKKKKKKNWRETRARDARVYAFRKKKKKTRAKFTKIPLHDHHDMFG